MGEGSLSQDDIDALLGGGGSSSPSGGTSASDLDALLGGGKAEDPFTAMTSGGDDGPSMADIAAALGPSPTPRPSATKPSASPKGNTSQANLNLLLDVTLSLTVELGRTTMHIKDILQLSEGSLVELDKAVGEDLDILANGKFIGRGRIVLIDDYYGIQITEILDPSQRF